jgi:UDP-GlcNAc3NAcA epimerase
VKNLTAEGVNRSAISLVGDLMYDAALKGSRRGDAGEQIVSRLELQPTTFVVVTIHRAENTDDYARLSAITEALQKLSLSVAVVWPMHPRTRAQLERRGVLAKLAESVRIIEPVGYGEMLGLVAAARVVVTDSGGLQKEAYFLRTPCVTLRDETEWVELLAIGANVLVPPTNADAIVRAVTAAAPWPPVAEEPYGDGHAGDRIVSELLRS